MVIPEVDFCSVQYTLAMMGYADEYETTVLELTYNYGVTEYDKGNAYAQVNLILSKYHIIQNVTFAFSLFFGLMMMDDNPLQVAISTDDVYKSAEVVNVVIQEVGGKITRQPGPIPGLNTKITSFLDPDGWKTVSCLLLS